METTTAKKEALAAFLSLYDYHTNMFYNVIEGITDDDAQQRLGTRANHVAWIAGSLVQERFALAALTGGSQLKQTADELFRNHQGIKEEVAYPALDEYRKDWERISPVLREIMAGFTEEQLSGPDPYEMPGGPYTLFDTITFCTDRESYCIGQLGLWRRLLGYDPAKYA